MQLKIEYMPPGELKPYENNAKRHPAEQIEQIKQSIKEFGFNDPIAIDKENVVIEGHGRLIAAIELGMEKVPVIRLDELTEEQRKAYTLVHNKLTMNSDFDLSILSLELEDLSDFNMEIFGFDPDILEEADEQERKDIPYHETISVVIDCENDEEAEEIFQTLTEEGYKCHISTL